MGLKPKEYSELTHKDYVLMCIGHRDKLRREEFFHREINYNIVKGWADPKNMPKKSQWWRIDGEPIRVIKIPSKKRLQILDQRFRNLGRRKNG